MITRLLVLLALVCAPFARASRADVYLSEEQALKLAFPTADTIERQLVALTVEERAEIALASGVQEAPRTFRCWIGRKSGATLGYAVIDDVLGKAQPITFMLVTDVRFKVESIEILAYRESHGGEVRQGGWRAQFAGKDARSALRLGADIRNIAGATISCRAVTDGVRLELACLSVLMKKSAASAPPATKSGSRGGPAIAGSAWTSPGASDSRLVRRSRILMGTTLEVSLLAPDEAAGNGAIEEVFGEVARLDGLLSTWREDTEVSSLNRSAGGENQAIQPELFELLSKSLEIMNSTQGAFDVTAGALTALYKRAETLHSMPAAADVENARHLTGPAMIELSPGHARLARPGCRLDFGGIGKGYALDRAAALLEIRGLHRALLNFGGQLLALDAPPGEAGWRVEVRDPARPEATFATVLLSQASISSTADYERGLVIGVKPVSHIVDPRTGRPVEGLLGVTVVCPTATEADATSTALYVLGVQDGARYCAEHSTRALIVPAQGPPLITDAFRALAIAGVH